MFFSSIISFLALPSFKACNKLRIGCLWSARCWRYTKYTPSAWLNTAIPRKYPLLDIIKITCTCHGKTNSEHYNLPALVLNVYLPRPTMLHDVIGVLWYVKSDVLR